MAPYKIKSLLLVSPLSKWHLYSEYRLLIVLLKYNTTLTIFIMMCCLLIVMLSSIQLWHLYSEYRLLIVMLSSIQLWHLYSEYRLLIVMYNTTLTEQSQLLQDIECRNCVAPSVRSSILMFSWHEATWTWWW